MHLLAIDGTSKMVELKYGAFLQSVIDFIIVAFCIFLFIRLIARISKKKKNDIIPEEKPIPSEDVLLLREIRDILKK
jgi:large conductance mechanosensitive channel